MPEAPPAKWKRLITPKTVAGALLTIGVVLVLIFLPDGKTAWAFAVEQFETWDAAVQANLLLACFVFFLLYVSILTPPIPLAAIIALLGGALFGRWLGTGIMSLASITAATLSFALTRYLFRDWVERNFGHRLGMLKRGVERDGGFYVVTLRLFPFIPFALINMGLALTPISLKKYFWISWITMLPLTFLSANAGQVIRESIRDVKSPIDAFSWPLLISISLLAFAPLIVKWVLRCFTKGKTSDAD